MQILTPDATESTTPRIVSPASECKVAYIMSRFPKLTETFILFEMLALERKGVALEVYPLLRARNSSTHPEGAGILKKIVELTKAPVDDTVMHAAAKPFVERAHFSPFFSLPILMAQIWFVTHRPVRYLKMLWSLIRGNWGSVNYLLGTVVTFPKCAYFARLMEREGITHVHAHFANHPAAAAFVIHGLTGIPYSFTAHGADFQVDQHMLKEKVAEADHVVTISDYNKKFFVEHCGEEYRDRIQVIRCGVNTAVFHRRKCDEAERDSCLKIVCTGTFYEVKGHRYLIEACKLLKDRGSDFICNLVGVGPLQEELQTTVDSLGLKEEVRFLGRQTREEIALLLGESDVLVAPSIPTESGRREGIPVVLMEAMASELPVVASRISGIPELVDHEVNGMLVPPKDAIALADALEYLQQYPESCRQLGLAGRRKVCEQYDQNKNAETLLTLFSTKGPPC